MTKKCKFDVEVTYNSDYFAEGEIRDTIKKAIKDLNDQKEKKFGRLKLCDPGKTNHGMTCNIESKVIVPKKPQVYIEEIAEFSELMHDEVVDSKIVLPDAKVEELMNEVRTAFSK
jgi:hypothetical protein